MPRSTTTCRVKGWQEPPPNCHQGVCLLAPKMPLPSSSLVAIKDQILVAKNNNNLVPPPRLLLCYSRWAGAQRDRGFTTSSSWTFGLFLVHSAPSARAAAAAGCAGHLRRGLMAQSAGAGAQHNATCAHRFDNIFSDGNLGWQWQPKRDVTRWQYLYISD